MKSARVAANAKTDGLEKASNVFPRQKQDGPKASCCFDSIPIQNRVRVKTSQDTGKRKRAGSSKKKKINK